MVPAEWTHLVATGTWLEVAVVYVELLYTERAGVVSVITVKDSIRLHFSWE